MHLLISLERLPAKLHSMHNKSCNKNDDGSDKETYWIMGLPVKVILEMNRHGLTVPREGAYCGGKLCKDTVTVTIDPPNDRVNKAIISHFKSLIMPPLFMPFSSPIFDEIVINNKKISFEDKVTEAV